MFQEFEHHSYLFTIRDDLVSQGEDLNLEREARSKGYEEGLE